MHNMPDISTTLLDNDPNDEPRIRDWNYRSVVGELSYLQGMVCPDITFAVQQCARFCNDPRRQQKDEVKRICRYLLRTKEKGLVLRPDKSRGLECFVDADWARSWQDLSSNDPLSAHTRSEYVIMYAGCPYYRATCIHDHISRPRVRRQRIVGGTILP